MSQKRKFDYTCSTMFNRANKLAGTFGADVFVVVKHQNNFRMYRNVGIEWAQELDINHLEERLNSTQQAFRVLRPAAFVNGDALVATEERQPRNLVTEEEEGEEEELVEHESTNVIRAEAPTITEAESVCFPVHRQVTGQLLSIAEDVAAAVDDNMSTSVIAGDISTSALDENMATSAMNENTATSDIDENLMSFSQEQWEIFAMELGTPQEREPTTVDPSALNTAAPRSTTDILPTFDEYVEGALSASLAGMASDWDLFQDQGEGPREDAAFEELVDWQAYEDYAAIEGLGAGAAAA